MNERILLTGATGNTGQVLAEELQRRGLPFVAMVRSQANQAKLAAKGIATVTRPFGKPLPLGMGMDRKLTVLGQDVAPSRIV